MKNTKDTYAKKAQKYGNCLFSNPFIYPTIPTWMASEIVVLTFQRLRGINGKWKRVEEVCLCVWEGGNTEGMASVLMWKPSWRGNLKGEVCQGHTRARTGKQKQDGSQADMEHSGERALTEKVSDSVTVGNRVLPRCYLCYSRSVCKKYVCLCV